MKIISGKNYFYIVGKFSDVLKGLKALSEKYDKVKDIPFLK